MNEQKQKGSAMPSVFIAFGFGLIAFLSIGIGHDWPMFAAFALFAVLEMMFACAALISRRE